MRSQSHLAYERFKKFSIAPESIKAIILALFAIEYR
jgi:hypothetical protein